MAKHVPGTPLPDRFREFLAPARYAAIATVDPDGRPRTAVVWYLPADDGLVVNSLEGRRWPANLRRTGRLSIAVIDADDGLRWLGLTGEVEIVDDQPTAQADIAAMARRYHADDPAHAEDLIANRFRPQQRVSFRLRADELHDHLGG